MTKFIVNFAEPMSSEKKRALQMEIGRFEEVVKTIIFHVEEGPKDGIEVLVSNLLYDLLEPDHSTGVTANQVVAIIPPTSGIFSWFVARSAHWNGDLPTVWFNENESGELVARVL